MWSALFCLASADNSLYLLYNILYFSYSVATSISSLHAFRHLLLCLACLLSWQLLFMHVSAACFFPRHRTFGASLYWSRWNVYLFSCSTHYMCSVECVIVEIRKVDFCTSICNIHVRTVYLSSVLSSSDNLTLQLSVTPLMNKLMEIVATKHRSHSTCVCPGVVCTHNGCGWWVWSIAAGHVFKMKVAHSSCAGEESHLVANMLSNNMSGSGSEWCNVQYKVCYSTGTIVTVWHYLL